MKTVSTFLCCALILGFSNSLDTIEQLIEDILGDDETFTAYFDCLMNRAECPFGGNIMKEKLPEGINTGCEQCNSQNKKLFWKTVDFLAKERPKEFKEILTKYDPAGKFLLNYRDKLDKKMTD